ncbi:MAG: ABC-type phosphate transport system substrate-binding protein [Sulfurimonas sp.]|jgi:ABC-type phosphate transport system substrate-binding protein
MKLALKSIICSIFFSTILSASEYFVVSNTHMKNLSKEQIKAIFLRKTTIVDNKKIIPINLAPRNEIRLKFESHVLNMSFNRLKAFWTKQHYLGHRPPLTMKSQDSIKAFIKKVDGSIGYIESSALDKDLKVIYRWEE